MQLSLVSLLTRGCGVLVAGGMAPKAKAKARLLSATAKAKAKAAAKQVELVQVERWWFDGCARQRMSSFRSHKPAPSTVQKFIAVRKGSDWAARLRLTWSLSKYWPRALLEVATAEREEAEAERKASAKQMRQARASLVKEAKAKGLPSPPRVLADRCWLARLRQELQEEDAAVEALGGSPAVAEDVAVEAPPGSPAVAAGAAPALRL